LAYAQRLEVADRLQLNAHFSSYPSSVPLSMLGAATSLPTFPNAQQSSDSGLRAEIDGLKHQVHDLSQMFKSLLELQEKSRKQRRYSSSSSDSANEQPSRVRQVFSRRTDSRDSHRPRSNSQTRPHLGSPTMFCRYCKKTGHVIDQCRVRPECPICHRQGHSHRFCPQNREFASQSPHARSNTGNGDRPA
jgi:hypothetical protein